MSDYSELIHDLLSCEGVLPSDEARAAGRVIQSQQEEIYVLSETVSWQRLSITELIKNIADIHQNGFGDLQIKEAERLIKRFKSLLSTQTEKEQ